MKTFKFSLITLVIMSSPAWAHVRANEIITCSPNARTAETNPVEIKLFRLAQLGTNESYLHVSIRGLGYAVSALRMGENIRSENKGSLPTYDSIDSDLSLVLNEEKRVAGHPEKFEAEATFKNLGYQTYLECTKSTSAREKSGSESDFFLKNEVVARYCGDENAEVQQIIGNQCIVFLDTQIPGAQYVAAILNKNTRSPYGIMSEAKTITFPPIDNECLTKPNPTQLKQLQALTLPKGFSSVQFLNFNEARRSCLRETMSSK